MKHLLTVALLLVAPLAAHGAGLAETLGGIAQAAMGLATAMVRP